MSVSLLQSSKKGVELMARKNEAHDHQLIAQALAAVSRAEASEAHYIHVLRR